jgi:hypothetical protein
VFADLLVGNETQVRWALEIILDVFNTVDYMILTFDDCVPAAIQSGNV